MLKFQRVGPLAHNRPPLGVPNALFARCRCRAELDGRSVDKRMSALAPITTSL